MKKLFSIFVIVLLLLSNISFAYAQGAVNQNQTEHEPLNFFLRLSLILDSKAKYFSGFNYILSLLVKAVPQDVSVERVTEKGVKTSLTVKRASSLGKIGEARGLLFATVQGLEKQTKEESLQKLTPTRIEQIEEEVLEIKKRRGTARLCGNNNIDSGEQCDSSGRICVFQGDARKYKEAQCTPTCQCPKIQQIITPTINVTPTAQDSDGDGIPDADEILLGTDPDNPDTDDDGISDVAELGFSDPTNLDTDNDGISDGIESRLGTDPVKTDTDGDGVSDADEFLGNSNPLDETNTPFQLVDQSLFSFLDEHEGKNLAQALSNLPRQLTALINFKDAIFGFYIVDRNNEKRAWRTVSVDENLSIHITTPEVFEPSKNHWQLESKGNALEQLFQAQDKQVPSKIQDALQTGDIKVIPPEGLQYSFINALQALSQFILDPTGQKQLQAQLKEIGSDADALVALLLDMIKNERVPFSVSLSLDGVALVEHQPEVLAALGALARENGLAASDVVIEENKDMMVTLTFAEGTTVVLRLKGPRVLFNVKGEPVKKFQLYCNQEANNLRISAVTFTEEIDFFVEEGQEPIPGVSPFEVRVSGYNYNPNYQTIRVEDTFKAEVNDEGYESVFSLACGVGVIPVDKETYEEGKGDPAKLPLDKLSKKVEQDVCSYDEGFSNATKACERKVDINLEYSPKVETPGERIEGSFTALAYAGTIPIITMSRAGNPFGSDGGVVYGSSVYETSPGKFKFQFEIPPEKAEPTVLQIEFGDNYTFVIKNIHDDLRSQSEENVERVEVYCKDLVPLPALESFETGLSKRNDLIGASFARVLIHEGEYDDLKNDTDKLWYIYDGLERMASSGYSTGYTFTGHKFGFNGQCKEDKFFVPKYILDDIKDRLNGPEEFVSYFLQFPREKICVEWDSYVDILPDNPLPDKVPECLKYSDNLTFSQAPIDPNLGAGVAGTAPLRFVGNELVPLDKLFPGLQYPTEGNNNVITLDGNIKYQDGTGLKTLNQIVPGLQAEATCTGERTYNLTRYDGETFRIQFAQWAQEGTFNASDLSRSTAVFSCPKEVRIETSEAPAQIWDRRGGGTKWVTEHEYLRDIKTPQGTGYQGIGYYAPDWTKSRNISVFDELSCFNYHYYNARNVYCSSFKRIDEITTQFVDYDGRALGLSYPYFSIPVLGTVAKKDVSQGAAKEEIPEALRIIREATALFKLGAKQDLEKAALLYIKVINGNYEDQYKAVALYFNALIALHNGNLRVAVKDLNDALALNPEEEIKGDIKKSLILVEGKVIESILKALGTEIPALFDPFRFGSLSEKFWFYWSRPLQALNMDYYTFEAEQTSYVLSRIQTGLVALRIFNHKGYTVKDVAEMSDSEKIRLLKEFFPNSPRIRVIRAVGNFTVGNFTVGNFTVGNFTVGNFSEEIPTELFGLQDALSMGDVVLLKQGGSQTSEQSNLYSRYISADQDLVQFRRQLEQRLRTENPHYEAYYEGLISRGYIKEIPSLAVEVEYEKQFLVPPDFKFLTGEGYVKPITFEDEFVNVPFVLSMVLPFTRLGAVANWGTKTVTVGRVLGATEKSNAVSAFFFFERAALPLQSSRAGIVVARLTGFQKFMISTIGETGLMTMGYVVNPVVGELLSIVPFGSGIDRLVDLDVVANQFRKQLAEDVAERAALSSPALTGARKDALIRDLEYGLSKINPDIKWVGQQEDQVTNIVQEWLARNKDIIDDDVRTTIALSLHGDGGIVERAAHETLRKTLAATRKEVEGLKTPEFLGKVDIPTRNKFQLSDDVVEQARDIGGIPSKLDYHDIAPNLRRAFLKGDPIDEGGSSRVFLGEVEGLEEEELMIKVLRNPLYPLETINEEKWLSTWKSEIDKFRGSGGEIDNLINLNSRVPGVAPKFKAEVNINGNPAFAMDKVDAIEIYAASKAGVEAAQKKYGKDFVTEKTFEDLREKYKKMLRAGLDIDDFQYGVLTRDQAFGKKGDVVFWDLAGLREGTFDEANEVFNYFVKGEKSAKSGNRLEDLDEHIEHMIDFWGIGAVAK